MRVVFLLFLLLLVPSTAFAQVNIDECNGNPTACSVVSSTTSSTTTALVGGIVLTVVLGNNKTRALKEYMRQNAVAIRRDVTLGAGATIDDLAIILNVSSPRFAPWLRQNRKTIFTFIDDENADGFMLKSRLAFRGT